MKVDVSLYYVYILKYYVQGKSLIKDVGNSFRTYHNTFIYVLREEGIKRIIIHKIHNVTITMQIVKCRRYGTCRWIII